MTEFNGNQFNSEYNNEEGLDSSVESALPQTKAAPIVNNSGAQFTDFALCEPLMTAIKELGFTVPTPIQEKSIPRLLQGTDLIACAQTGSGKTAAFVLPMFENLQKNRGKTALILAPTRELAEQIHRVCLDLGRYMDQFRTALLIGGTSMMPQKRTLSKNPMIIVATPGRLLDHLRQKTARLDQVGYLVLDEADRMLDMGFEPQLSAILRYLPQKRQSLLFSATIPTDIVRLSQNYLTNPERITIEREKELEPKIKETVIEVDAIKKRDALLEAINARKGSMLIFVRTQVRTERVCDWLEKYGLSVGQIHGGRSHGQRQSAIRGFREGSFRLLVATDIAARGLDIDHVEHVINYDLPRSPEDYVHRIGRTGRAGREGEAVSLLEPDERNLWRAIQRLKGGNQPSSYTGSGGGSSSRRPPQRFGDRKDRPGGRFERGGGRFERSGPRADSRGARGFQRSDSKFSNSDRPQRNDSRPERNFSAPRNDFAGSPRPDSRPSRDFAPRGEFPGAPRTDSRPPRRDFSRPERSFGPRSDRPKFGPSNGAPKTNERRGGRLFDDRQPKSNENGSPFSSAGESRQPRFGSVNPQRKRFTQRSEY